MDDIQGTFDLEEKVSELTSQIVKIAELIKKLDSTYQFDGLEKNMIIHALSEQIVKKMMEVKNVR